MVRGACFEKGGDGSDTFFWTDPWANETPLCERFGRLFDLVETKLCTVGEMFSQGRMGRLGSGGGSWGCEKRIWGSVNLYFLTSPCRHNLQTGGNQTLIKATLFGEHISYWLLRFWLLWMTRKISFGILRFPWRSTSSCGVYCVTGYPQKQIW
jgi:hypothetical protein